MIGWGEIVIITLAACVLIKPEDLPRVIKELRSARNAISDFIHSCTKPFTNEDDDKVYRARDIDKIDCETDEHGK